VGSEQAGCATAAIGKGVDPHPLAVDDRHEGPAQVALLARGKPSDVSDERASVDRLEVERRRAVGRKSVVGTECNLGGYGPDGAREGSDDDPRQHLDRFAAGDDEHRPALRLGLGPPGATTASTRRSPGRWGDSGRGSGGDRRGWGLGAGAQYQ
jgi:hypothetical protein